MTENRGDWFSVPATGGASLLTVFAVLCLTVFALLSLSTVRADGRLAQASAQAVEDYYAADRQAQEILAWLRYGSAPPEEVEVTSTVIDDLAAYGEVIYSYACPISEALELQVEVRLEGAEYRVLRWQAVPIGEWEFDDSLELWDGEFMF